MPTFECPTCNKILSVPRKEDAPFRPFCSDRCQLVDLGRWLDGSYRIAQDAEPADPQDNEGLEDRRTID